jgi:hypothetical protein
LGRNPGAKSIAKKTRSLPFTCNDAENAIILLKNGDFNIKKLAIVGQGYHTEDQVVTKLPATG